MLLVTYSPEIHCLWLGHLMAYLHCTVSTSSLLWRLSRMLQAFAFFLQFLLLAAMFAFPSEFHYFFHFCVIRDIF